MVGFGVVMLGVATAGIVAKGREVGCSQKVLQYKRVVVNCVDVIVNWVR